MGQDIKLVFHNHGLRSYIEVDLCLQCPRRDDKGCCGYYSPVFYPCDFAYWLKEKPGLVEHLFSLPNLTILDASVTLNSPIEGDSYHCAFHTSESGCLLDQRFRESVCRHFVCPGIHWETEPGLNHWRLFFEELGDYEIDLNNRLAEIFKKKGLSLRFPDQRASFLAALPSEFEKLTRTPPDFFTQFPACEEVVITRDLTFGTDWPL